jgi:lipopolysaccharide transport system ATP-binding protein
LLLLGSPFIVPSSSSLKISRQPESRVLFDGVWKKYRRGERYDSLRDWVPSLVRRISHRGSTVEADDKNSQGFWALKNVSFEVKPGEALGIIGPNGAGKSTTLKLLTKILKPTRGYCEVRGRIGALIEIAAGFHPDLTGRENIYFQGAVMGMKRVEIDRKFAEIVDFSGISDFIDTQVKRYSSGMNARLGFSIAAHLNPEVLLIDEVLSVGDFAFQQKAFDRIQSMVRSDIPVVIISHQLNRIASLCTHAILLDKGIAAHVGSPSECIAVYVQNQEATRSSPQESCSIQLSEVKVGTDNPVPSGERVLFFIDGSIREGARQDSEIVFIRLRATDTGQILFGTSNDAFQLELPRSGAFVLEIDLQMNVPSGLYLVETFVRDKKRGQLLACGPRTSLQVVESRPFSGSVQMNAMFRLLSCSEPAITKQTKP